MNDEINNIFVDLIKNLNESIDYAESNDDYIKNELIKWRSEITIEEFKESSLNILKKIEKWNKTYLKTRSLLDIDLNDYDFVSKEYAYIMGECTLIDELKTEAIDWQIGLIGIEIEKQIKERR